MSRMNKFLRRIAIIIASALVLYACSNEGGTDASGPAWSDIDSGGDSWSEQTLQKYSLNEKSYQCSFLLKPYKATPGQLDQLLER